MAGNRILWTAPHVPPPGPIWSRLKESGYQVLLAKGDEEVLTRIKDLSPRLWVGELNGDWVEKACLLRAIRDEYPRLPLLLFSRNPTVEQAVHIVKLGATDYVPADVSSEHLWAVLEGLLTFSAPKQNVSSSCCPLSNVSTKRPIAINPAMRKILDLARKIAPRRTTVLLQGESGTGKEVVARHIHQSSDRSGGPFVPVNCAALPQNLLESELFGHEKGAFTGAASRKKGKFELAGEGTLLLDEISEMPFPLQAKLLRVLQEREIDRVGGQFPIPIDVRVIATTNRDLEVEVREGNFRMDLYYRLKVVPLTLPPLAQRKEDILPLARHFLEEHASLNDIPVKHLSKEAEEFLKNREWPGNVRELENLMERSTLLVDSELIGPEDLKGMDDLIASPAAEDAETVGVLPLKEMERKMIFQALRDQDGNRTHAAKVLGISVRTLRNKLNEYKEELEKEKVFGEG